jgi:hypothetical protein
MPFQKLDYTPGGCVMPAWDGCRDRCILERTDGPRRARVLKRCGPAIAGRGGRESHPTDPMTAFIRFREVFGPCSLPIG